ncbi:hypothetical protein BCV70DRAFT_201602 [Testicularia cyperi]|uniref:Uncharacterized protein n=1 Tax=Testicularia cyperi TaxID=1882483 RepID=A0A317XNF7_9BASI|nr:hypothetical protein BCV70DRAFT_201602 [Testicularia cyperi]
MIDVLSPVLYRSARERLGYVRFGSVPQSCASVALPQHASNLTRHAQGARSMKSQESDTIRDRRSCDQRPSSQPGQARCIFPPKTDAPSLMIASNSASRSQRMAVEADRLHRHCRQRTCMPTSTASWTSTSRRRGLMRQNWHDLTRHVAKHKQASSAPFRASKTELTNGVELCLSSRQTHLSILLRITCFGVSACKVFHPGSNRHKQDPFQRTNGIGQGRVYSACALPLSSLSATSTLRQPYNGLQGPSELPERRVAKQCAIR